MTNLQTLTRELRERLSSQKRTWMLLAAPELAGALYAADLLLQELDDLEKRVIAVERRVASLDRDFAKRLEDVFSPAARAT